MNVYYQKFESKEFKIKRKMSEKLEINKLFALEKI